MEFKKSERETLLNNINNSNCISKYVFLTRNVRRRENLLVYAYVYCEQNDNH